MAAILVPLLHPDFWNEFLPKHIAWPIALITVELFHRSVRVVVKIFIAPGSALKRPFAWFFVYIIFSTVLCIVRSLARCLCC